MKYLLFLLLAAGAHAQEFVKPYSLSLAMNQKAEFVPDHQVRFSNVPSVSINYRTREDNLRLGLGYSYSLQAHSSAVTAEARYNLFQWGRREKPAKAGVP